jgi:hypothetical protein
MVKVWILSREGYSADDEDNVMACWLNRPTVAQLEALPNICIDEEVAVALQTENVVEDIDVENYFYRLEEMDVIGT